MMCSGLYAKIFSLIFLPLNECKLEFFNGQDHVLLPSTTSLQQFLYSFEWLIVILNFDIKTHIPIFYFSLNLKYLYSIAHLCHKNFNFVNA